MNYLNSDPDKQAIHQWSLSNHIAIDATDKLPESGQLIVSSLATLTPQQLVEAIIDRRMEIVTTDGIDGRECGRLGPIHKPMLEVIARAVKAWGLSGGAAADPGAAAEVQAIKDDHRSLLSRLAGAEQRANELHLQMMEIQRAAAEPKAPVAPADAGGADGIGEEETTALKARVAEWVAEKEKIVTLESTPNDKPHPLAEAYAAELERLEEMENERKTPQDDPAPPDDPTPAPDASDAPAATTAPPAPAKAKGGKKKGGQQ